MKQIFLVEDDREIARNLSLLLRSEGFEVFHAPIRQAAVDMLGGNRFDLALVDISLPDGNGFSLCAEIKGAQDIPVLFLTASGDEASVVTGLNMGADDYITKPFRPRELVARIQAALRKSGRVASVFTLDGLQVDTASGLVKAEALFGRTDWLLTTLLKLSRLDAGIVAFQRESVEVQALIKAALRPLLIPMELREIVPKTEIAAGVMLRCDQNWLAEALQNILKNCIESIVREGSIAITCADNPLFTELTIHDSGPGFDREELPHIFERFYRGKASGATGYGIGLALSRTIITRQGGTLAARNHPQGGALFVLRFPK